MTHAFLNHFVSLMHEKVLSYANLDHTYTNQRHYDPMVSSDNSQALSFGACSIQYLKPDLGFYSARQECYFDMHV